MRISTGMIYDTGVGSMQKRTSSLLNTQQQISSGRRILVPSDDPVAAARALEVTQARDINAGQGKTRDSAKNSLGIVDSQLSSASDLLVRVRELAVQGANAALSSADRKSVAAELRARFDELVALANSTDGTGNYLFGGYQTGNKPFSGSVENGVTYGGDNGLRSLAVSSSRTLAISDSGNDIFMGIKNGNGVFVTGTQSEKSTLQPPLTLDAGTISNSTAWTDVANSGNLQLRFWSDPAGVSYYDLVDVPTGNSLFTGIPSSTNLGFAQLVGTSTPGTVAGPQGNATGSAALTNPTVITAGVNDKFQVAVDGGAAVMVTLPAGSYAVPGVGPGTLAAQMQTSINLAVPATPVTVTINGGNQLVVTSDTVGAASAVTLANANTFTHAYSSGVPIALSSPGTAGPPAQPAFDYGAAVTASGTPANGDTFSIQRTAGGGIATAAVSLHQIPVMDKGAVTDAHKWTNSTNSGNLEVRFWIDSANALGGGANAAYYDLIDANNGKSLFTGANSTTGAGGSYTHAYVSGGPISFSGLAAAYNPPSNDFGANVTVTGTPANGDTFTVKNGTDAIGNGYFVTAPKMAAALNAGSGIIGAGEVLDQAKWNNPANSRNIEIRFWNDASATPAVLNYDLVDLETEKSLFSNTVSVAGGTANTFNHRFTAGNSIPFTGLHVPDPADPSFFYNDFGIAVSISGTPQSGDAFAIKASSSQSIFDTIGNLVKALETGNPAGTLGNTQLSNAVSSVLTNVSQSEDGILRVRANIGSNLSEVDNLDNVGQNLHLQYEQTLSSLQDIDYAKAITDLTRQQTELQAAQQSFAKISQLSLFNYL